MANSLPAFLPLAEAARKYGLSAARLKTMVENGTIRAVIIKGEIAVDENSLPIHKEDLPEYKKHAHLKGTTIWISEAARKYGIASPTIAIWVQRGIIETLGHEKNRRLIDEADVAYCAEVYRKRKGQGKWLFNPDGTPYKPKTVPLAT